MTNLTDLKRPSKRDLIIQNSSNSECTIGKDERYSLSLALLRIVFILFKVAIIRRTFGKPETPCIAIGDVKTRTITAYDVLIRIDLKK